MKHEVFLQRFSINFTNEKGDLKNSLVASRLYESQNNIHPVIWRESDKNSKRSLDPKTDEETRKSTDPRYSKEST